MKTVSYYIVFIASVYLTYGLVISQVKIKADFKTQKNLTQSTYDYKGVINVHSQEGSGQGTIPEILKAAYEAKLDFIIFTESTFDAASTTDNRYEENLLVLNGREYSYLKSKVVLVDPMFDYSKIKNAGDAHLFLSDYLENNKDGFVILKHPRKAGYEWEGEFASGIDAIEIISLRNHWRESWDLSKWNFISSLLMYPFNSEYAFLNIYQAPKNNLKLWNEIARDREIIGLIGSDAKSKLKLFGKRFLRFPTYKQLFLLSSNHIILDSELTGQLTGDSLKVFSALSKGQFYFSLDFLGDPKGFNFFAKDSSKKRLPMGTTVQTNRLELCYRKPDSTPGRSWAKVYLNGKEFHKFKKNTCIATSEKGNYNLVYYRKIRRPWPFKSIRVPWIYSNFIYHN